MLRRPPGSTRTYTLFPSPTLCRSLEALLRPPAELAGRLRGVDGVAQVVAGAVVDEGDEAAAGLAAGARAQRVDQVADHADHRDVALLAVAADVEIGRAHV